MGGFGASVWLEVHMTLGGHGTCRRAKWEFWLDWSFFLCLTLLHALLFCVSFSFAVFFSASLQLASFLRCVLFFLLFPSFHYYVFLGVHLALRFQARCTHTIIVILSSLSSFGYLFIGAGHGIGGTLLLFQSGHIGDKDT